MNRVALWHSLQNPLDSSSDSDTITLISTALSVVKSVLLLFQGIIMGKEIPTIIM
jgi:hypothetical protein